MPQKRVFFLRSVCLGVTCLGALLYLLPGWIHGLTAGQGPSPSGSGGFLGWAERLLAPIAQADSALSNQAARFGRKMPADPRLVFLAIDHDSISLDEKLDIEGLFHLTPADQASSTRALRLMCQPYPWPREVYAALLDRLVQAGARVVAFDLLFLKPAPPGDEPFKNALDRYRDRVVVGSNFSDSTEDSIATALSAPSSTLIPEKSPPDDRVGFVNFWPGADDKIERALFSTTIEEVSGFSGAGSPVVSFAARVAQKAGFGANITGKSAKLRFVGDSAFDGFSMYKVFVPAYWQKDFRSGGYFKDKIVVIGAKGDWAHDEHLTPFGSLPGPILQLTAINAILHKDYVRDGIRSVDLGFIFAAGLLGLGIVFLSRRALPRLAALFAANGLLGVLIILLFDHRSIQVSAALPFAVLNLSALTGVVHDVARGLAQRYRLRRSLERYVSHNVVKDLIDRPEACDDLLGGVMKPVTILFSDIRNFTGFSARTDPHRLVAQLNEYFEAMVECVFSHDGTLDKFIGDAVMAVWGNVTSAGPRADAINAVRAAAAMRRELARLNLKWSAEGRETLQIGMAIHHGDVVVGEIGSSRRAEITVIGTAVNATWKLQTYTKDHGSDLLISGEVADLVGDAVPLRNEGRFSFAEDCEPVEIFTLAAESGLALVK